MSHNNCAKRLFPFRELQIEMFVRSFVRSSVTLFSEFHRGVYALWTGSRTLRLNSKILSTVLKSNPHKLRLANDSCSKSDPVFGPLFEHFFHFLAKKYPDLSFVKCRSKWYLDHFWSMYQSTESIFWRFAPPALQGVI